MTATTDPGAPEPPARRPEWSTVSLFTDIERAIARLSTARLKLTITMGYLKATEDALSALSNALARADRHMNPTDPAGRGEHP